ncbi:MAG TPA: PEP-CTERM sorting domain-containing protein [Candidatus Tectomicrobia bacterium]|jgi:hypothetical protein
MQWKNVYPTLCGLACAASVLLAVNANAGSLSPLTMLPGSIDSSKSFSVTWLLPSGVGTGTYHGTYWDAIVNVKTDKVTFHGTYHGDPTASLGFSRISSFSADTKVSQGSHIDKYNLTFNSTNKNIYDTLGGVVSPGTVRVTAAHVPEPSTLLLFPGIGLAWLAVFRRKLFKKAQDTSPAESVTAAPAAV